MTLKSILGWFLGSSMLVLACGGATDDDDDDFLDEAKFRERFPTQVCAQLASCCNGVGAPIDDAACQAEASEVAEEMREEGVSYDGAAAAACLKAFSDALSRCALPGEGTSDICDSIYVGTIPEGGACQSSDQCAGDAACEPNATGALVCVTYQSAPRGVAGEGCYGTCEGDPSAPCAVPALPPGSETGGKLCYVSDGLHCDFTTFVCAPVPAVGEPCPDYYCGAGAYCDELTGTCRQAVPNGAACELSSQCRIRQCNDGVCGEGKITADLCDDF